MGRSRRGGEGDPVHGQEERERQRQARVLRRGQGLRRGGDLRAGAPQAVRRRRVLLWRHGDQGCDHRPGLLQRLAAPGDQGRGQHRRARTCCASSTSRPRRPRVRPRQEVGRQTIADLRPRRRHLRRVAPRDRRRRLRGARHAGDTHLGGEDFDKRDRGVAREGLQDRRRGRPHQGQAALQRLTRGCGEGEAASCRPRPQRPSPPVHHRHADGPKHIDTKLTRAKFEELCDDLITRCKARSRTRSATRSYRSTRSTR